MNDSRTRLFVVSPPMPDPSTFADLFAAAAAAGDIASLLLRNDDSDGAMLDLIATVMPIGYEYNVAILVEGDADLAARSGADGVHLSGDIEEYRSARALLGSDRIVGIFSKGSRHEAMELGEAGVDYIAFNQTMNIALGSGESEEISNPLSWWAKLFEVPSVAFAPVEADDVVDTIRCGADFIRPVDGMWSSADRAADTVRRYNAKIDEAG
jgi:thiamine-phosphate pyrophosphorylase